MMKRPDFLSNGIMAKNKIYKSPGILGKLYRKIDRKEIFDKFKLNFFNKSVKRNYEINEKLITQDCFKYLSSAYKIYKDYKARLCFLMKKFNFCTESELFLNLRIFKNNRGHRGKADSYNIELKKIIDLINEEIIKEFKIINKDVASAIYIASYIDIKSIYENQIIFSDDFDKNLALLISLFENDKKEFKDYNEYANLKQNNERDNKNKYKQIFSLPWIIEDIRKLLLN